MRPAINIWLIGAVFVAAGCADNSVAPVAPATPTALSPLAQVTSETSTDLWASIIKGETGPGSLYAIYVPRQWNGDVIYYGHGIRDALEPVTLGEDRDGFNVLRDQLGALGYALALSSFSENGYAIEDAIRRTHQLRGLFVSRFGQPEHSYLAGFSLGGLAVTALAEKYPKQYDGLVAICTPLGGTLAQLEYVVHVRALFDYFYPGILPGSASQPIPGYVIDQAKQLQIVAAVTANPLGLAVIASTAQTALEFTNQTELVTSLINALSYHARGADNVLSFTNGKFPVSNIGVTYSPRPGLILPPLTLPVLSGILAGVNAQITRFDSDRSAARWAEKNFTPSGDLQVPTITLHNRWDRLVPFFHEGMFAARVAAEGATDLLIQRANPAWGWGHCAVPNVDRIKAITDLSSWVETGVKPAS